MSAINDTFDGCRKTCSIIFGNASASQLRYLRLQSYTRENKGGNLFLEPFLRVYASFVELYMKHISSLYNVCTLNIESYKKTIDMLNQQSLRIKNEAEIEGLPLSQA